MRNKRCVRMLVFISSSFVIIFLLVYFICEFKSKYINNPNNTSLKFHENKILENYKIKFSEQQFLFSINEIIKDRYILQNKECYELVIGKNMKEVENNYFDIKFYIEKNSLKILVNKLFKNYFSIQNSIILEDSYLSEFIDLIIYLTNLSSNENNKYILNNIIRENYINIRNVESVEKIENKNLDMCISLENFDIKLEKEDNMLKISL